MNEIILQRCRESLLVHEGEEYLEILSILAESQMSNGDFDEAERCAQLALHGSQAANNKFNVMTAFTQMSEIYEEQGKRGLAIDNKRAELDLCIEICGQNHNSTMISRRQYTRLLLEAENQEEARWQASLALELLSQVYDPSSSTYAYHNSKFEALFEQFREQM